MIYGKFLLLIFSLILLTNLIYAGCQENQIDVNSASIENLDTLYGIGPAKAQAIIDARPFSSIDDLIRVVGIGPVTLENIKNQNLACVEEENTIETNKKIEENTTSNFETKPNLNNASPEEINLPEIEKIVLNPKVIKTEESNEILGNNQAFYGFIFFSVLLGILFVIKKRKI